MGILAQHTVCCFMCFCSDVLQKPDEEPCITDQMNERMDRVDERIDRMDKITFVLPSIDTIKGN